MGDSYKEQHERLRLRLQTPSGDWAAWQHKLTAGALELFGSPEAALLLTLLHPTDCAALINQRGRFLADEAVARVLEIIARHCGFSEILMPIEPGERDELDSDRDVLIERIDRALEQTDIEEILDCEDCISSWREAPLRRRARRVGTKEQVYEPRPTDSKRSKRSGADIEEIRNIIYVFAEANRPVTVRQTFYHLVSRGLLVKDEAECKATAGRLMLEMRRAGELPYTWVADNTRWIRKPRTFASVAEALTDCAATYRRAIWRDLPVNLEIWCEKDALAGVIREETDPYDVPLMVARGFSSDTYLFQVAEQIHASPKATYVYYLGDWDPAGTRADIGLEAKLRGFCPMADIHFQRIAMTPALIEEHCLATRATKGKHMNSDFDGESVDLDALPPLALRKLVRDAIERHIPAGYMDSIEAAEKSERAIFAKITGIASAPIAPAADPE